MGVQDPVGQGLDLRGLQGAGVLLAMRDAAQQHRDAHGRRLPRSPGPGADRAVPARLGRAHPGVDDDAVDAAEQPGAGGRSRHRLRRDGAGRRSLHPGRVAPRRYERELAGATHVGTVKGSELVGRRYKPLFPFFADTPNAFHVLAADFVSTEDGTGVVHMAPGFGEDDQNVCNAVGIPTVVPDGRARPLHRRGRAVGRACTCSTPTPRSSRT